MEKNDYKREFLIEYGRDNILIADARFGYGKDILYYYVNHALAKNKDAKYGEVAHWNNEIWCSVMAEHPLEALDIFKEKIRVKEEMAEEENE